MEIIFICLRLGEGYFQFAVALHKNTPLYREKKVSAAAEFANHLFKIFVESARQSANWNFIPPPFTCCIFAHFLLLSSIWHKFRACNNTSFSPRIGAQIWQKYNLRGSRVCVCWDPWTARRILGGGDSVSPPSLRRHFMWEFDISGAGSRFRRKRRGEDKIESAADSSFLFFSSCRSVCVGNWMLFLCCLLLLLLLLLSPPIFVAFVARRMWEIGAEKIFPPPPSSLAPNEQSGTRCGEIRQLYGEKAFIGRVLTIL